jgi:hypothetical protein
MRLKRIVNLHFWCVTVAAEGALITVFIGEGHDEVVDPAQLSVNPLSIRHRHGDRRGRDMDLCGLLPGETAAASSRHEIGLLQEFRIAKFRTESLEVAGEGVTPCALGLKVCLAGFRITDEDAGWLLARDVVSADLEAVYVGRDIGDGGLRQIEFRHALVHATVLYDRADQFAVAIVQDQFGADQVRTAFTASRIRSVTERAVHSEYCFAAADGRCVRGRVFRVSRPADPARVGRLSGLCCRWGSGRGDRSVSGIRTRWLLRRRLVRVLRGGNGRNQRNGRKSAQTGFTSR